MFEAIYLSYVKKNSFNQYHKAWKLIAQYMVNYRGAIESKIYFSSQENFCLVHSRWPSEQLQKENWPLADTAPYEILEASEAMEACKESGQQ